VSGGKGDDEHISEAQCMYDYLTARGVSWNQILMEDQSETPIKIFKTRGSPYAAKWAPGTLPW